MRPSFGHIDDQDDKDKSEKLEAEKKPQADTEPKSARPVMQRMERRRNPNTKRRVT